MCRCNLVKPPNIKFHENLFIVFLVVISTDGQTDMFINLVANTPKKEAEGKCNRNNIELSDGQCNFHVPCQTHSISPDLGLWS
jgi:hypothetical protein